MIRALRESEDPGTSLIRGSTEAPCQQFACSIVDHGQLDWCGCFPTGLQDTNEKLYISIGSITGGCFVENMLLHTHTYSWKACSSTRALLSALNRLETLHPP